VLRARWEFVDLDRGVLTVPLSKSGRPRHVPLSPAAVRVLEGQAQRRVSGNPFVVPSRILEGKPLQGLRKPWDKAKKAAGLAADLRTLKNKSSAHDPYSVGESVTRHHLILLQNNR
jgi:integrase